ncbi:MAG: DNA topoisomerase IB [Rhizobiaceae bacterium]|nr:DNA topoisomerase IB [Rhizobiaceae bacterium]
MLQSPARHTETDPATEAAVERASLAYVSDTEPGIRRKGAPKRFRYIDANGRKIGEGAALERIRALSIPPAWTDVWICPDADGHIQATGRDMKDRKQYRYHERWAACRDEVKFSSLAAFARALPKLRERTDADLRRRGLPRDKVLASIVWLLDNTMIRVGNAQYARDNKSFGLTTLRSRHIQIDGAKLRFDFKGKSGKDWKVRLTDRRMARVLKGLQELPGQHLFQYVGDDGERRVVRSEHVNAWIAEATGDDFTSKHFRTWGGTVRAMSILAGRELPEGNVKRALNAAIDEVAGRLGNTRGVCRRCYVHPAVIEHWQEGKLGEEVKAVKRARRKGLDDEEAVVAAWLEKFA